jgi:SRSO17 transposase
MVLLLKMDMEYIVDAGAQRRMGEYLSEIGEILGHRNRRESFAMYAMGLMGEGERKSAEPIAARACGDPKLADAYHQRLTHFLGDSDWNDRQVRRFAARYALKRMTAREPVQAWIVDDTGFLKQGKHSPGVQRQYTGSAGKITNCQIGVSLSVTTRTEHVPVDFELYLPQSWAQDVARRRKAHIPDEVVFKTKPELALDMIRCALDNDLPRGVVLADSDYGDKSAFRREVRVLGLDYAVEVHSPTTVWRLGKNDRPYGEPMSVADVGHHLPAKAFRNVTWREGTKGVLRSRFAMVRVKPVRHEPDGADDEPLWLLMEWPVDEPASTKFWLATLPRQFSKKRIVRLVKERYRTERAYQDLKGELGLDHFEGRTFRGWHHHVSAVLCCFAFVVAERLQRFSPLSRDRQNDDPLESQAGTPFPEIIHHGAPRVRSHPRDLAPQVSLMPPAQ